MASRASRTRSSDGSASDTTNTFAYVTGWAADVDPNVRAVVDAASRAGRGYLAVRVGRVLLYLEDRVAVDARPSLP